MSRSSKTGGTAVGLDAPVRARFELTSSSLLAPRFASATQKCVTQLGGLRGFRFSIGGAARYRSAAEASIAIGGGTPAPANT